MKKEQHIKERTKEKERKPPKGIQKYERKTNKRKNEIKKGNTKEKNDRRINKCVYEYRREQILLC